MKYSRDIYSKFLREATLSYLRFSAVKDKGQSVIVARLIYLGVLQLSGIN